MCIRDSRDGGGDRVTGVRTDDKGVDKQNQPKSNFEPGYDVKAKVVVLAEGARGSLTKQLIQKFDLMKDRNPQTYGVGVKELWEIPSGRIQPGEVIYTIDVYKRQGLRAAAFAVDRRPQGTPPRVSAEQRKYLRAGKGARSRTALSFRRAPRSALHERTAARIRKRSAA